jgi:ABC-2 type transport system ATP-binding protein
MITLTNLTKVYGNNTVLDHISLEWKPGIIYGLTGPNGGGKTTLMRCICGFSKPTGGQVHIDGKQIGKDVDFAPSTGIILESPGFLPHYSGLRNLLILAAISRKAGRERAMEAMRMVGLDPGSKKTVGKYSLGMRQRLGIAQAIMEDPDILMLDEPFNGLDKDGMKEIHALLQSQKSKGKLIILVSHYAQEIADNCDVIYEFANGTLKPVSGA